MEMENLKNNTIFLPPARHCSSGGRAGLMVGVPITLISAFLLIFSFPPFNLSLLAWVAFILLFFLISATETKADKPELTMKEIFALYYLVGLIFWAYHIWWLTYVTFLGYFFLIVYLASFMGLFGLFLKILKEKTEYPLLFLAPPLWVLFEFIRTYFLRGFPWSLLGYSQWNNIALIQISSITGVYGVSFLIIMFNAAFYDFYFSKAKKPSRLRPSGFDGQVIALITVFLIIAGIIVIGGKTALKGKTSQADKTKISVIQGNIPQSEKWDEGYSERIVNTYAELSIYAGKEPDISLVIWPETSYPDYAEVNSDLFKKVQTLTRFLDIPLLMGAVTRQNGREYNSALLILSDGEIKQVYNKLHLVPFGEYLPFEKIFSFLKNTNPPIGNFSKGEDYTIFKIKNEKLKVKNKFGVLICFEDLFPDLARKFTSEGAEFLVNITNDAHFCESPALWQHFTHSVFRAVENRRPVIRAANNGVSGFIDSYGRPTKVLNDGVKTVGARGFAAAEITPSYYKTFYTRFGNLFVYLNILYLALISIITIKRGMKKL